MVLVEDNGVEAGQFNTLARQDEHACVNLKVNNDEIGTNVSALRASINIVLVLDCNVIVEEHEMST